MLFPTDCMPIAKLAPCRFFVFDHIGVRCTASAFDSIDLIRRTSESRKLA